MLALRLPMASGPGVLLTLAMFWALWSMINAPIDIGKRIEIPRIEFTPKIVDSKPVRPVEHWEKPTFELLPTPPQPGEIGVPTEKPGPAVTRNGPVIIGTGTGIEIETPAGGGGIDHDAQPIVRILPTYPPSAAARGIEGWVQVQFSVNARGEVFDVSVVGASPRGVFDKATVAAVSRWLYSPKIVEGVAVERIGLQTVLHFNLD